MPRCASASRVQRIADVRIQIGQGLRGRESRRSTTSSRLAPESTEPARTQPSQKAHRSGKMDHPQDRDDQQAQREREREAVPERGRLRQSGDGNREECDGSREASGIVNRNRVIDRSS